MHMKLKNKIQEYKTMHTKLKDTKLIVKTNAGQTIGHKSNGYKIHGPKTNAHKINGHKINAHAN